jgi:AcrR family transcriptional regulator
MNETTRDRKRAAPQLRGERVVQKVLEATIEELSVKGLAGLSIEDVADRAGVAKTTVYRRWPTKVDLAVAAMHQIADDIIHVEDTGSLRGDLTTILRSFRDFAWTPRGQGLMRMMMTDVMHAEISEFARRVREEKSHEPRNIIHRAIARGELPRGTDPTLVLDVAFAAIQHYLCFMHTPVSDARIAQIIEVLLVGAQHGGAILNGSSRTNGSTETPRRRTARASSARSSSRS